MATDPTRVVVDTDTAGDDAMALLLAALSDRVALEGVTTVAGNVERDRATVNAKAVLDLAGADAGVYEGARSPLVKDLETAEYVHGEGGLGEFAAESDRPSGDRHAVEYLLDTARAAPGAVTLVCLGPLTNVALALAIEPDLGDLLESVWVMGGALTALGNVTPAAEYNFWVDPEAATRVVRALDLTLVDWGVSVRDATLPAETIERVAAAADDSRFAAFFADVVTPARAFNRETRGEDAVVQPDALTTALALDPDLLVEAGTYHVDVDAREGLTRGFSLVDRHGVTGAPARTRVVEEADAYGFERTLVNALVHGDPDR